MSLEIEQIKKCYESLGMSVEEIAENRGLQPEAVKMALMSGSAKFRKDCGSEPEEARNSPNAKNFTDEQFERVKEKMYTLALESENDAVAAKMCIYIIDDNMGRNDAAKTLARTTLDILAINGMLTREMQRANELIYGRQPKQLNDVPA